MYPMKQPDPLVVDQKAIAEGQRRMAGHQDRNEKGMPPSLKRLSRESRFWALRPTLLNLATGKEYQEILDFQKKEGAYSFDPWDKVAAEARARQERKECQEYGIDPVARVLDHWNYWLHFQSIMEEVFGLEVADLQGRIDSFGAELTEKVLARNTEVRRRQAELQKSRDEAEKKKIEQEVRLAELLETPPCPHRMEAVILKRNGKPLMHFDKPLLHLTLRLTDEDLRGHKELAHPILTGVWNLLRHLSIINGLSVNHAEGTFSITTHKMLDVDAFLDDYSRDIARILDLDPELIGPLSSSKASKVLGISNENLQQLTSVGEISPVTEVTITTGRLQGTSYMGYAARDVLALKDELDEKLRGAPTP